MDVRCILCDHPKLGHWDHGCHRDSFLRGSCDCDYVEPAPLSSAATADEHRERAAWWARRVDLTDGRMWRTTHGSEAWRRLERFRRVADAARHHHAEMAYALDDQPDHTPLGATQAPTDDQGGDDLFDLISIESLACQSPTTLGLMLDLVDAGPPSARAGVRARLEAEFDVLEPRYRRELLEDDAVRDALVRLGVVSRLPHDR